jgi:hypothetical protein
MKLLATEYQLGCFIIGHIGRASGKWTSGSPGDSRGCDGQYWAAQGFSTVAAAILMKWRPRKICSGNEAYSRMGKFTQKLS